MKNFHIAFLLVLIFSFNSLAQNNWQQFQSPEQVNDLLETELHLWFATNAGIIKVNKNSMTKTYFNQSNSALNFEKITAIEKEENGIIWATLGNMTLAKLEGNDWTLIPLPNELFAPQNSNTLNDLKIDSEGNKWMACDIGVVKFDGINWEYFNHSNTNSNFLGNTFSLVFDENEHLISSGITNVLFDGTEWIDLYNDTSILFAYNRAELFKAEDGSVWYHNFDSSIGHWDGNVWKEYSTDSSYWNPAPPSESFSNFTEDEFGNILLCTAEDGVFKLENEVWTKQNIDQSELYVKYGESFHYIDNQEIRWFSNLNYLSKEENGDLILDQLFDHTIRRNNVHFVKKDNYDKIYFGNGNIGNIAIFDNGSWSELITPFDTFQYTVRAREIEFTANNEMWVATNQGVFFYDYSTWIPHIASTGFPSNGSNSIEIDADGNLWIGSNDGLIKYDGTDWTVLNSSNSPLVSDYVKYLSFDKEGALWMYSSTAFVRKWYRLKDGIFEEFDASFPAILSGAARAPFVDNDNNIWFQKQNEGLLKYDGTTWETITIDNSDLLDNYVYSMYQDESGKIYFGTKKGISILDGDVWENLASENTPLPEKDILSMLVHDDILWAGSNGFGLLAYHPDGFSTVNQNLDPDPNQKNNIFPNPTNEYLRVSFFTKKTIHTRFQILNLQGQIIEDFDLGEKQKGEYLEEINVSKLVAGIYFFKINSGATSEVMKFIKI